MGFKKWGKEISFADLAVSKSLEHNRSLQMMKRIDKVVKWRDVEALLLEHYETGTSKEGADAYPPLMLLLPARRLRDRRESVASAEVSTTWRAKLGMGFDSVP